MSASVLATVAESPSHEADAAPRHSLTVRVTHWISALCFAALLLSGVELIISHPRFYWGEEGNVNTPALFSFPIPSSREATKNGYAFLLDDQNGWSRYLHFQTAWLVVATGLVYLAHGALTRHFQKDLLPMRVDLTPTALRKTVTDHLQSKSLATGNRYNLLQRLTYSFVIFGAFPFMIWTGLAMSPAVTGAFPFLVNVLGGHQSARTLHFFDTLFLVLFVIVHIVMVFRSGFRAQMRGMITGHPKRMS